MVLRKLFLVNSRVSIVILICFIVCECQLKEEKCWLFFQYFEKVKSYWTTDRSHFRSEWMHFQPFKYRRRGESSEFYPKPSKEVQATLHGTPLLQCTQITNGDPNTHIQRSKCINETMSFQPESFTVPNQKVHCLIITCTHSSDLQLLKIYQDAIEQSNVQIKPLTQCK
jgi:hypothetical protein